jgi:hypothetical protein
VFVPCLCPSPPPLRVVGNEVDDICFDSDLDEFSTELTKDGDGIFGIIGGVIEEDTGLPSPGAELSAARLFEISSLSLHMAVEGFTVRNGEIFLFFSISEQGLWFDESNEDSLLPTIG